MNGNVLLAHYGITVPADSILSTQFLVRSVKNTELLREQFDPTGIYYSESESIEVMLRVYLNSSYLRAIFATAGIVALPVNLTSEAEGEEEETPPDVFVENMFYVEYPISSNTLDTKKLPLANHPTYIRLYHKAEKNATLFDKKLDRYYRSVANISSMGNFEADDLEDDDEVVNDGLTAAPRLTTNSMQAQANAHRSEQQEYRERAVAVLDFFEEKVIKSGTITRDIPFEEAKTLYADMLIDEEPILSEKNLLADLEEELVRM